MGSVQGGSRRAPADLYTDVRNRIATEEAKIEGKLHKIKESKYYYRERSERRGSFTGHFHPARGRLVEDYYLSP